MTPRHQSAPLPVKIGLWRTEPGSEFRVAKKLKSPGRRLYKAAGFYDILSVESGHTKAAPIPRDVLNYYELSCLDWDPPDQRRSIQPGLPWLTVTLMKLNPVRFLTSQGRPHHLESEREFIAELKALLQKSVGVTGECRFLVLGAVGWAELVLVLSSDEADTLAAATIEVQRSLEDHDPAILKTHTVWGIDYNFVSSPSGRKRLRRLYASDVFPTTAVTYKSGKRVAERVVAETKSLFGGDPPIAFGEHDLEIRGDSGTIGDFFDRVIRLRKRAGRYLYSTATTLYIRASRFNPNSLPRQRAGRSQDLDRLRRVASKLAIKVAKSFNARADGQQANDVFDRLRSAFTGTIRFPIGSDAIWDMLPALIRLKSEAEIFLDPDIAQPLAETLAEGFQQRMVGVFSHGADSHSVNPLVYPGGLQRVLWAVESIPTSLLASRGVAWDGFVTFSMSHDFSTTDLDIITVPYAFAEQPAYWWVVFHETGHVFVDAQLRRKDAFLTIVRDRLANVAGAKQADARYMFHESFTERLACQFAFANGFKSDWQLYLEANWDFMLRWRPGTLDNDRLDRIRDRAVVDAVLKEQIDRLLFVRLCMSGERRLRPALLKEFVVENLETIRRLGGAGVVEELATTLLTGPEVFDYFDSHASTGMVEDPDWPKIRSLMGITTASSRQGSRRRALRALQDARQGRHVTDPSQVVLGALIQMLKEKPSQPRNDRNVHLTAILSLWNYQAHQLGRRLERLVRD